MRTIPTFWSAATFLAVWLSAPRIALAHGDLVAQIDDLTKQIESDPKNPMLHLRRGELYRVHADWKLAENDYDRVAQLDASMEAVDFCRGRLCFESGENERARVLLDKYLARRSDHVEALVTRARLLVKLGEHKAAAEDFTRAIEHATDSMPEYFLERARAHAAGGDTNAAIGGLDEGLKRLGPLVGLQLMAIDLELARKNFDGALSRLETISSRSVRKEKWLARRGEILVQAGRRAEAQKAFTAALAAIENLPPRLRQTPATMDLKKRVNDAVVGGSNRAETEKAGER